MPHSATGVSPFYANKSYNSWLMLFLKNIPSHFTHKIAEDLRSLHQFLQDEINTANQAYSKHANTCCKPTPDWPPSTLVWLNQQNLKTWRPSIKLDHKCFSPFKVLQKVSMHAYKLNLPPGSKGLYPVASPRAVPSGLSSPPSPPSLPAPVTALLAPLTASDKPAPPEVELAALWLSSWLGPYPSMPHSTPSASHPSPPQFSKPPPHKWPATTPGPLLNATERPL
ncbi:hypothetical protein E4T56_gene849 [Termitomyces sp. T112]|nr:hypothetical protein E4T56_gene849 [Termitomyces sp. T112]